MSILKKAQRMVKTYPTLFEKYEINTTLRLAHFFAQLSHESGLLPISENLNYSEKGLLRTFAKYFDEDTAKAYARHPLMIANRVYADRMDNGNEASGEGWKYRGRGYIQITGKANYQQLTDDTGIDYVNNPDKLLNEADALISALWYWSKHNLNELADADNVKTITKRINGGQLGLVERAEWLAEYKKLFK